MGANVGENAAEFAAHLGYLGAQFLVGQAPETVKSESQRHQFLGDAVVNLTRQSLSLLDAGAFAKAAKGQRRGDDRLVLAGHGRGGRQEVRRRCRTTHPVAHDDAVLPVAGVAQRDRHLDPPVVEHHGALPSVVPGLADDAAVFAGVGPRNPEGAAKRQGNRSVGRRADQHPRSGPGSYARQGVENVLGCRCGVEPGPHLRGEAFETGEEPRRFGGERIFQARRTRCDVRTPGARAPSRQRQTHPERELSHCCGSPDNVAFLSHDPRRRGGDKEGGECRYHNAVRPHTSPARNGGNDARSNNAPEPEVTASAGNDRRSHRDREREGPSVVRPKRGGHQDCAGARVEPEDEQRPREHFQGAPVQPVDQQDKDDDGDPQAGRVR